MSRILVSIVSQQTIPNVLFINEIKGIEKYLFITTEKMEERNKREIIIKACDRVNYDNSTYIIVLEDSIKDVKDKLDLFVYSETRDEDSFIVNLTGGTKIMSISTFDFFKDHKSEIFYIPFGKNKYWKIFPDVKHREFDLMYRFNLDEYLKANGISVLSKASGLKYDIEITKNIFKIFEENIIIEYLDLLTELRDQSGKYWYKKKNKKDIKDFINATKLNDLLQSINWNIQQIDKYDIKYLTGGWFEEYIYYFCSQIFDTDEIGLNYKLDIGSSVDNEFDVLFVHENCLYIIEAKTNLKGAAGSNIINNIIYKSSSLNAEFGLSCKSYLLHLDNDFKTKRHYEKYIQRAKLMGLKVIGTDELIPSKIEGTIKSLLD